MKVIAGVVLCALLLPTFAQNVRVSQPAPQDLIREGEGLLQSSEKQNLFNHPLALETAGKAFSLFQEANHKPGIAAAYFQIGICNHAMRDFDAAMQNYQLALQIWRELDDTQNQAETLLTMGMVEHRKGDWPKAMSDFDEARILGRDNPDQLGKIANSLGYLFNQYGMPESALVQYQQALDHFKKAQNERGINRTIVEMGFTQLLLKDYATAETTLQQALSAFDPASIDAAECHEDLGRVYLALQDYSSALEHFQPAASIYERAKNDAEAERVRMWIGQVYEQQGNFSLARPHYLQALAVFRRIQDRLNEAEAEYRLGRIELKTGNVNQAEIYFKQSIATTEDVRTNPISRDVTAAFSASVHDRYQAYIASLLRQSKVAPSSDLFKQAFEASELSRGRSLSELLRDTQTNLLAAVDPKLAERERTLRQEIRSESDHRIQLLGSKGYKQEEVDKVEATLERLRAEHQQLYDQLKNLNPAYGEITQPTAYSLEQIQKEVIGDDQTGLLEYFLGEETSYVWVVTRNSIKITELAGEPAITRAVQNLYTLLSAKPKEVDENEIDKRIDELAAMVITPIADQLPSQRLIVVADGALNYIPFQVLHLPNDQQPLVASREIINAPSASILGQLRQEKARRAIPENVLAAFGYPAFPSNYAELKGQPADQLLAQANKTDSAMWASAMRDIEVNGDELDPATIQPLLYSREELAALREVAGPASYVVTGFNASRETLQQMDLSRYAILHFATHGVLDPNRPEKSGFLLSNIGPDKQQQNGFITVQDVYQLRAPVSLVVLSACRTGLGKDVKGEGLISLTRGFMYAGASSIAASLWNVNDEVTAELMKLFYANMLQKGLPAAAALRAAQNTIRQKPEWRSPHFWAAFTLQGEYTEPIKVAAGTHGLFTTKRVVLLAFLLLAFCTAGWWFYWRRRRRVTV